jgi:hypothetical protein
LGRQQRHIPGDDHPYPRTPEKRLGRAPAESRYRAVRAVHADDNQSLVVFHPAETRSLVEEIVLEIGHDAEERRELHA